jgi:hypothetical protein
MIQAMLQLLKHDEHPLKIKKNIYIILKHTKVLTLSASNKYFANAKSFRGKFVIVLSKTKQTYFSL